ncbi:hypothetical protein BH11BAC5_BH11BAC5_28510 [soil metagenome]
MLKKSYKYLVIAIVNLTVLTILLAIWTDELELRFNDSATLIEIIKIIGFTFLTLIGMRMLVSFFRNKNITRTSFKIKISVLLTFLISSYLYTGYIAKIYSNVIINGQFRRQIAKKISDTKMLNGTKGENLTFIEYQQITKMSRFPTLPAEASNIQYAYDYDGFLPDYSFSLKYDLPKEMKVDTIDYKNEDFTQFKSFEIIGDKKRVTYFESDQ